jgi:hypothetical protein
MGTSNPIPSGLPTEKASAVSVRRLGAVELLASYRLKFPPFGGFI